MQGHEKIIQMRMAGYMPSCVFIDDFKIQPSKWSQDSDFLNVCVEGDSIGTLDLSFLVGLDVRTTANTENRAKDIFDAAIKNGAKTVAAYSCTGRGSGKMLIHIDGKSQSF
jgi:hypothetical protein